jgi:hypothetical protein
MERGRRYDRRNEWKCYKKVARWRALQVLRKEDTRKAQEVDVKGDVAKRLLYPWEKGERRGRKGESSFRRKTR